MLFFRATLAASVHGWTHRGTLCPKRLYIKGDAKQICHPYRLFLSRRRTHIKLLRWEGDGFALYSKRLEQGSYELPKVQDENSFLISHKELLLILQGISLQQIKYRKRYKEKMVE